MELFILPMNDIIISIIYYLRRYIESKLLIFFSKENVRQFLLLFSQYNVLNMSKYKSHKKYINIYSKQNSVYIVLTCHCYEATEHVQYYSKLYITNTHCQIFSTYQYHLTYITFIIVGYSIFIVTGNLPECEADVLLKVLPANQPVKPRLINEKNIDKKDVDSDFKQALNASKKDVDTDDKILQETLKKSMEGKTISCKYSFS